MFAALGVQRGMSPKDAAAEARLAVAVTRGLLLNLVATGNRWAIDAAMERYITTVEGLLPTRSDRGELGS